MGEADDVPLEKMASLIAEEVDPVRIILFGSRARDDHKHSSDIDLLIVQDRPFKKGFGRRRQMARIWKRLSRYPVSLDLLVFTPEEIECCRNRRSHVVSRALREGRILYERS